MQEHIVNRVKKSPLITINLLDFFPKESRVVELDIKPFLYQGMILKEKEFRNYLSNYDWQQYKNKVLTVFCSEEVIVPQWSYMLIASYVFGVVEDLYFGKKEEAMTSFFMKQLDKMNVDEYVGKKVILKGCNDNRLNAKIFLKASQKLLPCVQSLMYGEACSTVPVYKKK